MQSRGAGVELQLFAAGKLSLAEEAGVLLQVYKSAALKCIPRIYSVREGR
jgi:hypothetical protein